MKLNQYIFKKFMNMSDPDTMSDYFTEEDIENWIVDWYKGKYARMPPIWLKGGKDE
jgi:hypothetical protein